jgi:NADH:ubiquinone oxidoreductase subunit K
VFLLENRAVVCILLSIPIVLIGVLRDFVTTLDKTMSLEGILSRETLQTHTTLKGLDRQMDSLMSFEIMIPAERLHTMIASKRTLGLGWWWSMAIGEVRLIRLRSPHSR